MEECNYIVLHCERYRVADVCSALQLVGREKIIPTDRGLLAAIANLSSEQDKAFWGLLEGQEIKEEIKIA